MKVYLSIFNNIPERKFLDKYVWSNVIRLGHSSLINSILQKTPKLSQLFALGPKLPSQQYYTTPFHKYICLEVSRY